jgi:hypothetical protein
MMATNEDPNQDGPARLKTPALSVVLGLIAVCFTFNDLLAATELSGRRAWQPLGVLALNLLMVGAIWGLVRLKPSILKAAALTVMLGIVAWAGFGTTAGVVNVLVATKTLSEPWAWQTVCVFASNLLIGVGAIWSLLWLKPWKEWKELKGSGEPVSPSTRRTNKLYWLTELLAALGLLALLYGTNGMDNPFGLFSNSPVSPGIAIFAITSWVLAMAIGLRRYLSADEYERKANDFGKLVAFRLFYTVTPAWWVAGRAGLLPQPDAMVLWVVTMGVNAIGSGWRRNR